MSAPQEQVQQAVSTRMPKRWPLVSQLQARNSSVPLTKDARLINCFAEYDAEDKEYWIYKRLGLGPSLINPALPLGYGMYTDPASGYIYFVVSDGSTNTELYVVSPTHPFSAPFLIQSGMDVTSPFFFTTVNTSPDQTIVLGNSVEAWTVKSFVPTKINDANFPAIFMRGLVYLDGTLYAMDQFGTIWGTAGLDNPLVWSALNFIQASSNSDLGVALVKQLTYIIALKQWTTQIFFDNGNATGSPLAPVPDAQIPLGCASSMSVQTIDNTILWMTANQTASPQIVQMDNLTPQIVSTPAVERILASAMWSGGQASLNVEHRFFYSPPVGLYSWVLKHSGHRFYGLSIVNLGLTLVYDLDQSLWYIWTGAGGSWWPVVNTANVPQTATTTGIHLAQNYNGNIYPLDAADVFPSDNGTLFPVDIYTPNMDFGTDRRKHLKAMYFNADRVPSYLTARYSDDDYKTWSNPRMIDLNLKKPRLTDCGTFLRRRAYHFDHLANTGMRIKTIDLQMDLGTL